MPRPQSEIEVYSATLRSFAEATGDVELDLAVSKGTYIRTLAEKFGALLQAPAHAFSLRRTRVGPYTYEEALPSEQLDNAVALLAALARDTAAARRAGIRV